MTSCPNCVHETCDFDALTPLQVTVRRLGDLFDHAHVELFADEYEVFVDILLERAAREGARAFWRRECA